MPRNIPNSGHRKSGGGRLRPATIHSQGARPGGRLERIGTGGTRRAGRAGNGRFLGVGRTALGISPARRLSLFQKKFPDIKIQIVAEPIADMLPKTAVAMAAKSDRYDVIHEDYNFVPQFIAQRALEPLEPYLDKDPAFKKDILADIPENVLDLYRDKPAAQGGKLYGLPPDSNCQLQFYRVDVFDKAGIKPALTWDEAIENAKVLSDGGKKKVVGAPLKRGFWAAHVFITMLRSYGGDWFDKMEARRLEGRHRDRRRPQGDGHADAPGAATSSRRRSTRRTTKPTRRC